MQIKKYFIFNKMKIKIKAKVLVIFSLAGFLLFSSGCDACGTWPFRACIKTPYTLIVWNVFDDSDLWKNITDSYAASVRSDSTKQPVRIEYYKKSFTSNRQYEDELNNAIAAGKGPDIFVVHNDWIPRYQNRISPLDGGAKSAQNFSRTFVDVVSDDFLIDDKIYGVPLSVDTLALYYNVDLLNSVGIFDSPRTWDDFKSAVSRLTIYDNERTSVLRAGAAMGTDKNINRSSDILALLMMQSGAPMVDREQNRANFDDLVREEGKDAYSIGEIAFQFYTDFANPAKTVYTWNPALDYSIDMFYQGRAAMMFNYSYHIPTIKSKAAKLNFAVAPMPQISGTTRPVNYANYWAMTVSVNSKYKQESWDFLAYITNPEINKKYLDASNKPTAQKDLIDWQANGKDLDMAVFAKQSLTAKSWYQIDPVSNESILNDNIHSVILGRVTPKEASGLAASQITQAMNKN